MDDGAKRYRPRQPARSVPARIRNTARRAIEMRNLYANWPLAAADRLRLLRTGRVVSYRLRNGQGPTVALLATTGCWDIRLINEIWAFEGYLRYLPAHVRRRPALTVVDVGANRGFFSSYVATKLDVGRLVAIEPDPLNASMLEFNLIANGWSDRAEIHRSAVTAEPMESITLFHARLPGLHTTVPPAAAETHGLDEARYSGSSIDVAAETLEEVLAPLVSDGRRIDVLKIDTEGSELAMIRSLPDDVLRMVDYMVAETEYQHDAELVGRLQEFGLSVVDEPPFLYASRDVE